MARRAASAARVDRHDKRSSSELGVQDQSSSNRYWSNGTSQHSAILPPAMRNTPTVCQVRSWPSRSSWPSAKCTACWSSARMARGRTRKVALALGPAGAEIAQDFLVT